MVKISTIAAIMATFSALMPGFSHAQMTRPEMRATTLSDWQSAFRTKALAAGISAQVFDAAFQDVRYNSSSRNADANQPEFTRAIWDYLDSAVSARNVTTGREKAVQHRDLLRAIERRYDVPAQTLLAIWALETNYGSFRGRTNTIEALANAAHDGRRREFAETELIAALKIITSGEITAPTMLGGWSGAMGHTQFMPSTYLRYAQDQNRDGRRDIWSDDPADALASSAHYLSRLGWDKAAPWGMEVTLPNGFDYALTGEHKTQTAGFWHAQGVRANGHPLPDHGATALLAPAGAQGPVFAIFPNFQVIRQYNMSVSYSLAVGHLSDRISGGEAFSEWPRNAPRLTLDETRELQKRLNAMGLDTGGIDGRIGPKTAEAVQIFQARQGMLADGYPTPAILHTLRR